MRIAFDGTNDVAGEGDADVNNDDDEDEDEDADVEEISLSSRACFVHVDFSFDLLSMISLPSSGV